MTREEANKKVAELQAQIDSLWEDIEEICTEHKIVVSRPNEDAYREYFYADKETAITYLTQRGYDEDSIPDWIDFDLRTPGWIGSSEFE